MKRRKQRLDLIRTMIEELTLKFQAPIRSTIVLDLLNRALAMYEFMNDSKLNETELHELGIVQSSVYDCMNNDPTYDIVNSLNQSLDLEEPVYQEESDQDFMSWLIENGHIEFNDDGTVTLPPPSEEFKQKQREMRKKYEMTQELIRDYVNQHFDEEQRHWIGIKS